MNTERVAEVGMSMGLDVAASPMRASRLDVISTVIEEMVAIVSVTPPVPLLTTVSVHGSVKLAMSTSGPLNIELVRLGMSIA
jgi:hypothetical protein